MDFDGAVRLYVKGDLQGALQTLEAIEQSGETGKKEKDLKKAVSYEMKILNPQRESPLMRLEADEVAEALCEVGFAYGDQDRWDRAEQLFLEAESKSAGYLPACVALAELYGEKGEASKSLDKWLKAASIAPDNPAVQLGLAVARARTGETSEAEGILRSLVTDLDMGVRAQTELGRIVWEQGRFSEAKGIWEAAISQAPLDGSIYFAIAECCTASQDIQGARIGYRKALELGYLPETCRKRLDSQKK